MSSPNFNRALGLWAVIAVLPGCGAPPPLAGRDSTMLQKQVRAGSVAAAIPPLVQALRRTGYKATAPLLFVTNTNRDYPFVSIYRAKAKDPAPLATISDGVNVPSGACIDGNGTLYVTNEPSSGPGWVSEYPLGKTTPSRTLTDGIYTPGLCAIDGDGNLWIANIGGPNVTEYLPGEKKPHTVITKDLVYPIGVAIDRSGNLYVGNGFGGYQQNVEVYAPGSVSPTRTITNGVTSPCGLAVDSNGTLYVANEFQSDIAEYRSGQSVPFQTITQGINSPGGVAVDKNGVLYVSNIGNSTIAEFASGSLTPLKRQVNKGLHYPVGIAYYPALLP